MQVAKATSELELVTRSDGSVWVRDARGSAHLKRLAPGVVLYTCTGSLGHAFYAPMVAVAQRELDAHGKLAMFVDGWDLRSVDTAFREAWTLWFKAHRERFGMQLLVRTKLMEMAASLANLFTGLSVITTHSSVASWERACTRAFPGFGGRGPAGG